MSLHELKAEAARLTTPELDELAACVNLLRKKNDPVWLDRAVKINAAMDAGHLHAEEKLRKMHREIKDSGEA